MASEHALCARFNVSRPTIRQALDVLVQEGRLTVTPGVDLRHAHHGLRAQAAASSVRGRDDRARGRDLVQGRVARGVRGPSGHRPRPALSSSSSAYRVVGVRHGDDGPFQHMTASVPGALGATLSEEDFLKGSILATPSSGSWGVP